MNSNPYFNNRMDGIEIAESLLYKDLDKPYNNNYYSNERQSQISNDFPKKNVVKESIIDCKLISESYSDRTFNIGCQIEAANDSDRKSLDLATQDRFIVVNNSAFTLASSSTSSHTSHTDNSIFDHLVRSGSYFRPISPDIFCKTDQSNFTEPFSDNSTLKVEPGGIKESRFDKSEVDHWPLSSPSFAEDTENKINCKMKCKTENENCNSIFKIYSQSNYDNTITSTHTHDTICYREQEPCCFSQPTLIKIDTQDLVHNNKNDLEPQPQLRWEKQSTSSFLVGDKPNSNTTSYSVAQLSSSHNAFDPSSIMTVTTSYSTPTITIPKGSYIFIPFTTPNYQLREAPKQNTSNIDLSSVSLLNNSTNALNKLIIGCYPVVNQMQDVKMSNKQLPKPLIGKLSYHENNVGSSSTTENFKLSNSRFQNSASLPQPSIKSISKKLESSAEFNQYLENLNESHKMLIKEKNKISMDKNFLKDGKTCNLINKGNNYERTLTKLEKELNSIINSLFEMNVLISKIEAIRGISFIEPFYNMIQKSVELIQSFQWKNVGESYSRNSNLNKITENEAESQIENLKQLYIDLQKFRNFLWASYTNLNFDQQRQLSVSLSKLKLWTESKTVLRNNCKSKESNNKYQLPSCSVESLISCQNFITNSSKPTVKFENNSITLPRTPFTIPVSHYPQIQNRMTTILHGYSSQPQINNTQFSYFQTPLSNFSHPQLINTNKFTIGSNCRISYGPQHQIYTATPLLANSQSNISPRNFVIAQSSLVTPIIYQNNNRQIINNGSLNYMVYNPNPQII